MHVNDPHANADNDDFTAAERAELDADAASNGAPTGAQPAAAAEPAQPAAPAAEPAQPAEPDPTARALNELAATQERTAAALAEVAKATQRQEPAPTAPAAPEAPQEPDWDAERKALKAKYDAGEIEDSEYEEERETLMERKAEWKAEQRANATIDQRLKQESEQQAKRTQEARDQEWETAQDAFLKDPKSQPIFAKAAGSTVFNAFMQEVCNENPNAAFEKMFAEASKRTREALQIPDAAAPDPKAEKTAIEKANAGRKVEQAPPDLSRAPQAGAGGEGGNEFADLDGMDVDQLENRLARMSESEVERFLESAPGGLLDNPRG